MLQTIGVGILGWLHGNLSRDFIGRGFITRKNSTVLLFAKSHPLASRNWAVDAGLRGFVFFTQPVFLHRSILRKRRSTRFVGSKAAQKGYYSFCIFLQEEYLFPAPTCVTYRFSQLCFFHHRSFFLPLLFPSTTLRGRSSGTSKQKIGSTAVAATCVCALGCRPEACKELW